MLVNKHPKHTRARQARPTLALLPGWNRVLTRTLACAARCSRHRTARGSERIPTCLSIAGASRAGPTIEMAVEKGFRLHFENRARWCIDQPRFANCVLQRAILHRRVLAFQDVCQAHQIWFHGCDGES